MRRRDLAARPRSSPSLATAAPGCRPGISWSRRLGLTWPQSQRERKSSRAASAKSLSGSIAAPLFISSFSSRTVLFGAK